MEIKDTERLYFKKFGDLTEEQKELIVASWDNPFNARYNAMKDARKDLKEICDLSEPSFTNLEDYYDCMLFRVAFSKETNELIATCRFGQYYKVKDNSEWDFGFNVLLKHWFKGYGSEIVKAIIEVSKSNDVKTICGSADIENYGSYLTMIKNGFRFASDKYGDYEYIYDLTKPHPTNEQIKKERDALFERTKKDLGNDKFDRLQCINGQIKEMVERINNGEDEKTLVEEYFEKLNAVEEFKMS